LHELAGVWQSGLSTKRVISFMLILDLQELDTQRIGRMGELVVELELLARGWMVGNFNATTMNSAGWDLFATKAERSVKIRVKAKRPGTSCFTWSRKRNGRVFDLIDGDCADYVAAVSFEAGSPPAVYVLPAPMVEDELLTSSAAWLAGEKRGGGQRKDTSVLRVHIDGRVDVPGHGYAQKWESHLGAWGALDADAGRPL
jgi:hypothetical protein